MTQYMQEAGAMKQLTDAEILHLWDTHVAYETGYKGAHLSNKDKLAFASAVLAAAGLTAVAPASIEAMARAADCVHVDLNGDRAKALERLAAFAAAVRASGVKGLDAQTFANDTPMDSEPTK